MHLLCKLRFDGSVYAAISGELTGRYQYFAVTVSKLSRIQTQQPSRLTNSSSCATGGCGFPNATAWALPLSEQARRWTQQSCEFGKRP